MGEEKVIAGLDIGTTKIAIAVAVQHDQGLDIVGLGQVPCVSTRRGIVVNIEGTTEAIRKARIEAELMSGLKIHDVVVGVAGDHIRSFDSKGMVAVRHQEVTASDVQRVIDAAKAVAVPADREVLHVLARDYKVDDQGGIFDPVGMAGVRLEANVHIITGGKTALQNITKATEKAGLVPKGLVLESLASAKSVLSKDERDLGVALVDMGGGTCDVVIFLQGSVAYTASIPLGGMHITNDIAVGLRTPPASADALKVKYGCALASMIDAEETIDVEGVGTRGARLLKRRLLCDVIEPRAEEILNFINNEIQKSQLAHLLGAGVVLTGGSSQLEGLIEMAEFVFDMPVRRGGPLAQGGLKEIVQTPTHATAVGLLLSAVESGKGSRLHSGRGGGIFGSWGNRLKAMLDQAF